MKISVELLPPAGNFENLKYALAYEADAVYAGIPKYSLWAREKDFTGYLLVRVISLYREKNYSVELLISLP
jgi:putative protease